MNCEFCDSPLQPGNQMCPGCGAAQSVAPPPAPVHPTQMQPPAAMHGQPHTASPPKSKIVAGLLGIFIGFLGIHNFYLGNTGKGTTQLILGLLGCATGGITSFISGVWGFIEGIMILTGSINTDSMGRPLSS